jgi:polyisoprenoid-binding protein YceI
MKLAIWMVGVSLLVAGCGKKADTAAGTSGKAKSVDSSTPADPIGSSQGAAPEKAASAGPALTVPNEAEGTKVALTPENAKIQFIGTHVGPKPDPMARVGTFKEFAGVAVLGSDGQSLDSVALDIQAGSLEAPNGKLTNHLNTEDFLDTRSHPTVTFKSKSITKGAEGKTEIVGDLTLHGVTKEITIPAAVTINDQGLALKAEFTIDRTDYGMDRMLDRVEKAVDITVTIGQTAGAAE